MSEERTKTGVANAHRHRMIPSFAAWPDLSPFILARVDSNAVSSDALHGASDGRLQPVVVHRGVDVAAGLDVEPTTRPSKRNGTHDKQNDGNMSSVVSAFCD